MSGIRPDDVLVREVRWRELTPTPVAPGGGLLPAVPAWWPRKPDDDALAAAAARGTPVLGETRLVDGVTMREATFLWCDDQRYGESPSVLIHLNTLTDNHRTHIAPALANRVPGTGWWALHVLLPDDALVGYRIVVTRDRLPDDVGARRECWKRVHAEGRPDALCPDRLHDGFGFVSSLWEGPGAVTHPEWSVAPAEGATAAPSIDPSGGGYGYSVEVGGGALDGFDAPGDSVRRITLWQQDCCGGSDGGRRERGQDQGRGLLVLLDGEIWRRNDVVRRLGARAASWDLLLVDSGSLTMRARDLADPRRSRELVIRCLEAVRSLRPPCDRSGWWWPVSPWGVWPLRISSCTARMPLLVPSASRAPSGWGQAAGAKGRESSWPGCAVEVSRSRLSRCRPAWWFSAACTRVCCARAGAWPLSCSRPRGLCWSTARSAVAMTTPGGVTGCPGGSTFTSRIFLIARDACT